ncbi:MAG: AAA family ATPase, partial [Spirochaetota bacterium]
MYERMQRLLQSLSTGLHERDEPIRLGLLASAAGESLFLLGSPGTGKSLIARRLQQAFLDARSFTYLMGRFSTPDEVFGPLSIRALREEDRYERSTDSYLPDSDVVFLDEIWKASPPIQNALLTALNERRFRNGTQELRIPLKVFIGASNELPAERDEAAAFWDRFLVRLVVEPIRGADAFSSLLEETIDPYRSVVERDLRITNQEYEALRAAETSIRIPPDVVDLISAIRDELATGTESDPPIYVSDRRWKKIGGLLRMSAVLHDRDRVEPIDCAIIRACAWSTLDERSRVDRVVTEQLASRSGRQVLADQLTDRFDALRDSYRGLSVQMVEDDRARPKVYRDEYYRLLPHGTTA